MEPSRRGAGFSEASPGVASVPATGPALIVTGNHVRIPAKAAAAIAAPMNFNKTALNLTPPLEKQCQKAAGCHAHKQHCPF